jgi:hypothetical protein
MFSSRVSPRVELHQGEPFDEIGGFIRPRQARYVSVGVQDNSHRRFSRLKNNRYLDGCGVRLQKILGKEKSQFQEIAIR